MADVQPLRALRYDPAVVGELANVVAPPYDVIDAAQRAELIARSPFNVVAVDLPLGAHGEDAPSAGSEDPYVAAGELFESWQAQGAVVRDEEPALWAHTQDYTGPRRPGAHASRVLLPGAHRGLRPRPRAPARADASGSEGGSAAAHARDADEHLTDLLAVLGPDRRCLAGDRTGDRAEAVGGHQGRRRHRASPVARVGPGGDRRGAGGDRRRGAADRRRTPPLRDDAGLRGRGRWRRRPPLHPHVPGGARGSRA